MGFGKYLDYLLDNIWVSTLFSLVIAIVLYLLVKNLNGIKDLISSVVFPVIIFTLILTLMLYMRFRHIISPLWKFDNQIPSSFRLPFRKYVRSYLEEVLNLIRESMSHQGAPLNPENVKTITNILFEAADSKYDGTDSNAPTKFMRLYPDYLMSHEKNIARTQSPGTRILILDENELIEDAMNDPDKVFEFLNWHYRHNVNLKLINPETAIEFSRKHNLPEDITDIGIWHDTCVLLFKPMPNGKIKLYLRFKGTGEYENTLKYFEDLEQHSKFITPAMVIGAISSHLQSIKRQIHKDSHAVYLANISRQFSQMLVFKWEDFVWCEKRWQQEKAFLESVITKTSKKLGIKKKDIIILDTAAGIGCEFTKLRKEGYYVIANEISPAFQMMILQRAHRMGIDVKNVLMSSDWREIDVAFDEWKMNNTEFLDRFGKESKPHLALLLGNSLCLLMDKRDQLESLERIRNVLSPGGVLVIDERNFQYILDNKDFILENPLTNFKYHEKVVYLQRDVVGVPIDIKPNKVTFAYVDKPRGGYRFQDWEEYIRGHLIGTLEMYPFKRGELKELLKQAGFKNIRVYSDYDVKREGYSEDADFFVYVAEAS